ncbi:hypothetical protein M011DRAFT_483142 [Sporormia fimetaria CBS 119925]|uniref:Uncharacterized protein n=1 Tax=Sporormia fimetaria CBS 119925 TaxID=1340428 RepID=A0A6A6VKN4_9PLEO|nr:hypothetical protein M011DRAFT_483142 [Sporormia fimetaria CBS 119925]
MRYDNWDAILFPRDSLVPLQEFRTAFYAAHDEYGRQLPTLSCYVASLPPSTPFRVSMHSWTSKTKPSALIESRRKPNQRVVFMVSVIVDGTRLFHDVYEMNSRWPQEIVHEKRYIGHPTHRSSNAKPRLEFPPFRHNVLMQPCWDARDNSGRIKVLLSEQLIGKSNNPAEIELGAANDIVCFLFQHAPRDILEQVGIAWPIRNPLYLPTPSENRQFSSSLPQQPNPSFETSLDGWAKSPMPASTKQSFSRKLDLDTVTRRNAVPHPEVPQFPRPPAHDRGYGHPTAWEHLRQDPVTHIFDDVGMNDSWLAQRRFHKTIVDVTMPDMSLASPSHPAAREGRSDQNNNHNHARYKRSHDHMRAQDDQERHVVMTFREDQLGRLVEAFSPPKTQRSYSSHGHRQFQNQDSQINSQGLPPKVGNVGVPGNARPSNATLSRHMSLKDMKNSPVNNYAPTQEGKENRNPAHHGIPTPSQLGGRLPTPHSFPHGPRWSPQDTKRLSWEAEVDMHEEPTMFSSMSRLCNGDEQRTGKGSPVPVPSAHGSVRSRKENMNAGSPATTSTLGSRHDKSLLPQLSNTQQLSGAELAQQNMSAAEPSPHALLDADTMMTPNEPKSFMPGHRRGMSSMERVETELFSALGEELSGFPHTLDTAVEDTSGLAGLSDFDTTVPKRKRSGSTEEGVLQSPLAKMMREQRRDDGGVDVDADIQQMQQMRGD